MIVALLFQAIVAQPALDLPTVRAEVAAAQPAPCPVPLPDTLAGSAGTLAGCMTRPDASRPTVIQAKNTVTATDATWAVTWDRPFERPPIYTDARIYGANDPYLCTVQTSTETGAAGKCFKLVASTLPSVVTAVPSTVVSPFAAAGANLSVRVVGRQ